VFGRRKSANGKRPPFQDGWTDEMLRQVIGRPNEDGRDDRGRDFRWTDQRVDVVGYGHSVNKFASQRTLWGWATDRWGNVRIAPAVIHIGVYATAEDAGYIDRDQERVLPEFDPTADVLQKLVPGRIDDRPRHQCGHAVIHGRGGTNTANEGPMDPAERQRGMVPVLDVVLKLTRDEWQPVRECLEAARWRDGRGPTFSVRIEWPFKLDVPAIRDKPWLSWYPVTRFWLESVVHLSPTLKDHPVFADDIQSGSIEQWVSA
jgi:hypothetical protein